MKKLKFCIFALALLSPGRSQAAPGWELTCQVDPPTFSTVGTTINYSCAVVNTGTSPIRNIVLSSNDVAFSCPHVRLESGRGMICSASALTTELSDKTVQAVLTGSNNVPPWTATMNTYYRE